MIPDEIRSRRWRLPASITAGEVEVYAVYGSRAAVRAGEHDLVVDVTSLVPAEPRVWRIEIPENPGPEVTAVRATKPLYGFTLYRRIEHGWELTRNDGVGLTIFTSWRQLLEAVGPLTDATKPEVSTVDDDTYAEHLRLGRPQADDGE